MWGPYPSRLRLPLAGGAPCSLGASSLSGEQGPGPPSLPSSPLSPCGELPQPSLPAPAASRPVPSGGRGAGWRRRRAPPPPPSSLAAQPPPPALEAGEPEAALKLRRPPAALRRLLHLPPGGTSIPTRQHLPPSLPLPRRRACGTATRAQHGSTVELSPAPLPSSPLRGGGQIRTLPQRRASRRRRGRRRRRAGPPLQRRPSSPPSAASSRGALRSRSGLRGVACEAGRPRRCALARLGRSRGHGASSSSPLLPGQRPWRVLRDPAAGMAHGEAGRRGRGPARTLRPTAGEALCSPFSLSPTFAAGPTHGRRSGAPPGQRARAPPRPTRGPEEELGREEGGVEG